jgi:glycine/D-amino acid oxidase-like deaminating enzyme
MIDLSVVVSARPSGSSVGGYVATGHSVWGMLNAPATGEALAELILDGAARNIDLAAFAPERLMASK